MKQLFILLFLFIGIFGEGYAQSLDQAKKHYNEGNYEEAKPVFERLVKQSPNNSSYNLWYGVCCYETGDMITAKNHLLTANKRKVAESCRYLAKIYTQMYRFDEAINMWEDCIALMKKKKEDTTPFEEELSRVEKMQRMLNNTENVQIIDSMVVDKDRILSAYFLSEDCGRLETYHQFFEASRQIASTVYINAKGDQAYYARPDESGKFTLYTQSKLLDIWSDEKRLFPAETEEADHNYPFVLGDGVTLYFASKGNGTIGGYDLFITRYNTSTSTYLTPEQMGMPFNSPANDYLMVIDDAKGAGWFVSDRFQPEGKACVYLFIPDETRKRIESTDDEEWLRKRAALMSVSDTWIDGNNYAGQISLARTDLSASQKKIEHDFEFVVNDQATYHNWNDFKSTEARSLYEKVLGIERQIKNTEQRLDELRTSYAKGNDTVRKQLKPAILSAEDELTGLLMQKNTWLKMARNAENVLIKK
ncbi:MAG: CDC27 family protein [Tannerella sp.]|jgi:tetratricopeptide (TPR) repeat protein|nr:CDC27 family protein [Tannerella sp.]